MAEVKRADWVRCIGEASSRRVGLVRRVARDGSWADVDWGTHTKRMGTRYLEVEHTIELKDGWTVTDMTRKAELEQGEV